jgi:hypothetical protein
MFGPGLLASMVDHRPRKMAVSPLGIDRPGLEKAGLLSLRRLRDGLPRDEMQRGGEPEIGSPPRCDYGHFVAANVTRLP